LNWTSSVSAGPSDIIEVRLVIQNFGNQATEGLIIKDSLPTNIFYNDNLKIDGILNSGNPITGLYIGSLTANQTKTITYQIQVASNASLPFGTTTFTLPTNVTGQSTGSVLSSSTAYIYATKSGVQGVTNIPTGIKDNFLVNSFLLPLLLILAGIWIVKSGLVKRFRWFAYASKRKLTARINQIKNN